MNKHIGKVAVDRNFRKRRYRQIGRLLYYYCCVLYMKRIDGKWVRWYERDTQTERRGTTEKVE